MTSSDREPPLEPAVVLPNPEPLDALPVQRPLSILQHRGMLLVTLFVVTGALGIPLLWINPQFSTFERVFWSITLLIYTTLLLVIAGGVMLWMYHHAIATIYS